MSAKPSKQRKSREVICPSCGGAFSIEEPKCPYCGTMNPEGAEKEYMGKLRSIEAATANLVEEVQDDMEEGLKTNSKRVLRFGLIFVVIIFFLIILSKALLNVGSDNAMDDFRAREQFKETCIPQFEELYEQGKDEEMLELLKEHINDPGFTALYNWPHYGYLTKYDAYTEIEEWNDLYEKSGRVDDLFYAVYPAMELVKPVEHYSDYKHVYSDRDLERIEEFSAYAEEYLETTLGMKAEEVDSWIDEFRDEYGNVKREEVRKYLRENVIKE